LSEPMLYFKHMSGRDSHFPRVSSTSQFGSIQFHVRA